MNRFGDYSIRVKNFKSFGPTPTGFDLIKPVNLIIGRNNSGKSALLDMLGEVLKADKAPIPSTWSHKGALPEIIGEKPLVLAEISQVFAKGVSSVDIPMRDHWAFGAKLVGARIQWREDVKGTKDGLFVSIGSSPDGKNHFDQVQLDSKRNYLNRLAGAVASPLKAMTFKRIAAERDIRPEGDNPNDLTLHINGAGATNIIQNFINKQSLPSELVEEEMLAALNMIFGSDAQFKRISCQKLTETGQWGIFLEEEGKGKISLSDSGSGLKTIILVLINVILLPKLENRALEAYIFGFEELENHLHPALLRRLLGYIQERAQKDTCTFFITTHSNVAIDSFSKNKDAQILHVVHNASEAEVKRVSTYIDNKGVLDDLDVRASDLLQSNGIIWVEGPSDRIYLNRWISLWSGGALIEGIHFQSVFYGGRLLAHLSGEEPGQIGDGVAIFSVNRNAAIMIDSDKRCAEDNISATKERIQEEMARSGGPVWMTSGREIENYIPRAVVVKWLKEVDSSEIREVQQYEDFFEYLDQLSPGKGAKYRDRKPLMAEELSPYFSRDDLDGPLDLKVHLDELCNAIRGWNGL